MVLTDTLMTVFQTTGADTLVKALKDIESAMRKLNNTQLKFQATLAGFNSGIAGTTQQLNQFTISLANQITEGITGFLTLQTLGRTATRVFHYLVEEVRNAVQAYSDFGKEVMDIRDLTGSSGAESAQAVLLARISGMSDMQQIRETMRMSRSVFDSQGRAAMGLLGVPANPNATGLALFNQIADAYQQSKLPVLMKSKALEDIFGARSAANLLPLLRLTHEQRAAVEALSTEYDSRALPAIQQFQFASAMLGETLMLKIVFPIAQAFMPVMESLITIITFAANAMNFFNKALGGILPYVVMFQAIGSAVFLITTGIISLRAAMIALLPILRASAAWESFLTALQPGGLARVAAAAAITGGVVAIGAYTYNKMNAGDKESGVNSPGSKMNTAADKMLAAAGMMQDGFSRYWKLRGLDQYGVNQLQQQMALGAIG